MKRKGQRKTDLLVNRPTLRHHGAWTARVTYTYPHACLAVRVSATLLSRKLDDRYFVRLQLGFAQARCPARNKNRRNRTHRLAARTLKCNEGFRAFTVVPGHSLQRAHFGNANR